MTLLEKAKQIKDGRKITKAIPTKEQLEVVIAVLNRELSMTAAAKVFNINYSNSAQRFFYLLQAACDRKMISILLFKEENNHDNS